MIKRLLTMIESTCIRSSILVMAAIIAIVFNPSLALALSPEQRRVIDSGAIYFNVDPGAGGSCTTGGNADLDQFLRGMAYLESRGNPTAANPGSSARGKYQYISSTWRARASLYPPAGNYDTADQAPEAIQDAVAYIEYAQKWVQYEGDTFTLALSHFYPAAIDNPEILESVIPPNTITIRGYAEGIIANIASDIGRDIPLLYDQAPEFQTHLDAAVPDQSSLQQSASGSNSDPCSISSGGLDEQQARAMMMNYGENRNGDSESYTINWDNCNGGGSNCVTFSQFFLNRFTQSQVPGAMGNGKDVVRNLGRGGVPTGNTPQVYAVFSWTNGGFGHTGVVLGIEGDTVIVGHASCSNPGIGRGNGTLEGGGSGFIKVGNINDPQVWLGKVPTEFAYPQGVDTERIGRYVNGNL